MRRGGPMLAAVVVIVANLLALAAVARNRAGEAEAEAWLSERELPRARWTDESTGVFLRLEWPRTLPGSEVGLPWLDRAKLESLGFDCDYPVDAKDAGEHYGRMVPRRTYVVLELDGPAWSRSLETSETQPTRKGAPGADRHLSASRLVPVDVGLDAAALRRLHPDRTRRLIAPALVTPRWTRLAKHPGGGDRGPFLSGRILGLLVDEVHVPKDLAARIGGSPRYEVLLRYGARHEPWVADVRASP